MEAGESQDMGHARPAIVVAKALRQTALVAKREGSNDGSLIATDLPLAVAVQEALTDLARLEHEAIPPAQGLQGDAGLLPVGGKEEGLGGETVQTEPTRIVEGGSGPTLWGFEDGNSTEAVTDMETVVAMRVRVAEQLGLDEEGLALVLEDSHVEAHDLAPRHGFAHHHSLIAYLLLGQQAMEASLSLGRKPGAQLKQGRQDQEIAGLGVAAAEEQNNEGGRERRHPHPDGPTHPSRKDDTEQQEDRGQQEGKGMGEGL